MRKQEPAIRSKEPVVRSKERGQGLSTRHKGAAQGGISVLSTLRNTEKSAAYLQTATPVWITRASEGN